MKTFSAMTVGDVIDETYQLLRSHFFTFVGLSAFFAVPPLILILLLKITPGLKTFSTGEFSVVIEAAVGFLYAMTTYPLYICVASYVASESYLGRPISIQVGLDLFKRHWKYYLFSIWGTWMRLAGWALAGGMVGGLVGGILGFAIRDGWKFAGMSAAILGGLGALLLSGIKGIQWVMVSQILAIEHLDAGVARERSRTLMKKRWNAFTLLTLAAVLIVIIIQLTLTQLPMILIFGFHALFAASKGSSPAFQIAAQIFQTLSGLITTPFSILVTVLFYYDTRIRKEGFDLEQLAAELSRSDARPAA